MSKLTISVQAVTENVEASLKALGDFKRPNLSKASEAAVASPVSNISNPGTPAISRAETQVCKTGLITENYADDVINAMKECIKGLDEEAADDLDYGKDPKNPSKLNKIFNNTLRNYITPLVGDPNKQERQIPKGEYFKLYKPTKLTLTGTAQTAAGSTWVLDPAPEPSYLEIKLTVDKNPKTRKYSRISNSEPKWVNPKGGERESAQTIYYFALKQSKTPFTDEEPQEPNASNNEAAKKTFNAAKAEEAKAAAEAEEAARKAVAAAEAEEAARKAANAAIAEAKAAKNANNAARAAQAEANAQKAKNAQAAAAAESARQAAEAAAAAEAERQALAEKSRVAAEVARIEALTAERAKAKAASNALFAARQASLNKTRRVANSQNSKQGFFGKQLNNRSAAEKAQAIGTVRNARKNQELIDPTNSSKLNPSNRSDAAIWKSCKLKWGSPTGPKKEEVDKIKSGHKEHMCSDGWSTSKKFIPVPFTRKGGRRQRRHTKRHQRR